MRCLTKAVRKRETRKKTETGATRNETTTTVDKQASASPSRLNQDVEVRGKLYERNGIRLLVISGN